MYASTQRNVDTLTVSERKVAQKNLHVVQFVGTPPPPESTTGMWVRLDIGAHLFRKSAKNPAIDLVIDARHLRGQLSLVGPRDLITDAVVKDSALERQPAALLRGWLKQHGDDAVRLQREGKYSDRDLAYLLDAMGKVKGAPLVVVPTRKRTTLTGLPVIPGGTQTVFFRVDPPARSRPGQSWQFSVVQRDHKNRRVQGGATYVVEIVSPTKR